MNKYKVTRTDGTAVPDDEPYFVVRAKDILAIPVVEKYVDLVSSLNLDRNFQDALEVHVEKIYEYQNNNRDKVKIPD